MIDANSGCFH